MNDLSTVRLSINRSKKASVFKSQHLDALFSKFTTSGLPPLISKRTTINDLKANATRDTSPTSGVLKSKDARSMRHSIHIGPSLRETRATLKDSTSYATSVRNSKVDNAPSRYESVDPNEDCKPL